MFILGETQAPGSLPGASRVYRSPARKLAIKCEQSRDSWKAKHHAVKRKYNKLLERLKVVRQRREHWMGTEPLQHHDVQLLALEPVITSPGEVVCEQFAQLAAKFGVPPCVVSENGPDLRCGVRMFRGIHAAIHPMAADVAFGQFD